MESKSLFLISNGSSNYFPKNTLTNFRNKLPEDFDVNDYEVAVKSHLPDHIFLKNLKHIVLES